MKSHYRIYSTLLALTFAVTSLTAESEVTSNNTQEFSTSVATSERNGQYNDRVLVPAGHWVYDAMQCIAAENRATTLANSAPLSIGEIKRHLSEISYDALSSGGKVLYRRIIDYCASRYFATNNDTLNVGIKPAISLSGFYKTSDDSSWIYDYYKRNPLMSLPLNIAVLNKAFIECDIFLGQNYWAQQANDTYCNIPLVADSFDMNFPTAAYGCIGADSDDGAFFTLAAGMGKNDIGNTMTGGIILSDAMTGAAYARASLFTPRLRYTFDVQEINVDKYLYMHRFEGRPLSWLSIGLYEGVLVAKPIELRFMSPISVFHGFAAWRDYDGSDDSSVGSLLGAFVEASPLKYTRFYALFMMNQYQPPYELDNWGDDAAKIPNAYAWQGGAQVSIPVASGYWDTGAEFVYTNPYVYLSADEAWSFYRTRKALVAATGYVSKGIYEWIGSPFGPDSIAVQFKTGYTVPGKWSAYANYRFLARGEKGKVFQDDPTAWATYYTNLTPEKAQVHSTTGITEISHTVYVNGEYAIKEWITVGGLTGIRVTDNVNNNTDTDCFSFELAAYATFNF